MITPGLTFLVSVVALLLCIVLWRTEQNRGDRVMFRRSRLLADRALRVGDSWLQAFLYIWNRYVWQLGWRYVIHVSLRAVLISIASLYDRLVNYFEHNRRAAKHLRRDKQLWKQSGHWFELSNHKRNSALSDKEKIRRKQVALEGGE